MNSNWVLVEVKVGLANQYNSHVIRNHSMNINNDSLEELSRLAITNNLSKGSVSKLSGSIGGLEVTPNGRAFIEDGGWGDPSRGLCMLKLVANNNYLSTETQCVVIGYISGGSVIDGQFPMDARFVPVKTYMSTVKVDQGISGLLTSIKQLTSINQCELGNPYNLENSYVTRPEDVFMTGVSSMLLDQKYSSMSGFENIESDALTIATSSLSVRKIIPSKYENSNTASFSNNLISSTLKLRNEKNDDYIDEYSAYNEATNYVSVKENEVADNPFFNLMSQIYLTPPDSGYPFFEIQDVFPTFDSPGVLNINLISEGFESKNNALDSDIFGTANIKESLAAELAFVMTDAMLKYRLANIHIQGTNSPDISYDTTLEIIPNTGIFMLATNAMPLLDGENDVFNLQQLVLEKVANDFYYKHTIKRNGDKTCFNINVDCNIYSDIIIEIIAEGEPPEKAKRYAFGFFADNRFSPIYCEGNSTGNKLKNYYQSLNQIVNL